jgi:hypothetical protein
MFIAIPPRSISEGCIPVRYKDKNAGWKSSVTSGRFRGSLMKRAVALSVVSDGSTDLPRKNAKGTKNSFAVGMGLL